MPNKAALTVRQPLGVAGLIIAANTPIANVAWKVFPALLCGNTAVLKAVGGHAAQRLGLRRGWRRDAGLPAGVLNVVHGLRRGGRRAAGRVARDVDIVSFTGSTAVGRCIARTAGERLAKVCLELGGKNPLVVCDDADLERGGRGGGAVGVQQRRPALRGRQPAASSSTRSTTGSASVLLERGPRRCAWAAATTTTSVR